MHRTWDVTVHPKWLVFEVEGQLQIRPAQYETAQHLMTHPGAIMQLNMGEGKTRVILPMLALHWAAHKEYVVSEGCHQCVQRIVPVLLLHMLPGALPGLQQQPLFASARKPEG